MSANNKGTDGHSQNAEVPLCAFAYGPISF